jgi:hypothetical protein
MIVSRRILLHALLVLAVAFLGTGPVASAGRAAPEGSAPGPGTNIAGRLKAELKKQGLEVKEGYFQLWRIEDCPASFAVMETCFFNNPTAPYVLPVVPYWPDEFVDPATAGAFGRTRPGYGTTFRLDPKEAIVIYGFLPPEAAYFGQQSYLFTRKGTFKEDNDTYEFISRIGGTAVFFHTVPANPERIVVFSSLSDSHNNVVIEQQSGAVWNQFRYFIITPDQGMDAQVRQVLRRLSVAEEHVFTEGIPSNVRIGLDADADDFLTGFRYSMPADGGAKGTPSDRWRHHPALRILRIRDARPEPTVQRYPAWEEDSPKKREAKPEAYLRDDLTRLVSAVAKAWGQPCGDPACSTRAAPFIDTQSEPFNLVGPKCEDIGMDCQGDTQDASYQFRAGFGFDDGQVYAVIGTLGTATGNATYVSLGVNNFRLRLGAKNVDGTKLMGSATPGFYPGVQNLDKFYVYYFTRDCEGLEHLTHGFCLSVEDTELVIPPGDRASFVERDYLKAGTSRGPDSTETLPSIVLRLQRPAE